MNEKIVELLERMARIEEQLTYSHMEVKTRLEKLEKVYEKRGDRGFQILIMSAGWVIAILSLVFAAVSAVSK